MTIATFFFRQMDRVARRFGYRVFPEWTLQPSQIEAINSSDKTQPAATIPEGAAEYLHAGKSPTSGASTALWHPG